MQELYIHIFKKSMNRVKNLFYFINSAGRVFCNKLYRPWKKLYLSLFVKIVLFLVIVIFENIKRAAVIKYGEKYLRRRFHTLHLKLAVKPV